jgi:dolichol-phosphate mannosyltransferase
VSHDGKIDVFISAIVPTRNHAAIMEDLLAELHAVLSGTYTNFEVIVVDENSSDDTAARVEDSLKRLTCIRLLRLTRTVGREIALTAGFESAIGDFVVSLEPDRDPPAELRQMIERARAGSDIVLGRPRSREPRALAYRALRSGFYGLSRWVLSQRLIPGLSSYRVISRRALNALMRVRLRRRHFVLMAREVGFDIAIHSYSQRLHALRTPPPSLSRSVREGLSLLVHNSTVPLRLAGTMGLLGSLLSTAYAAYVLIVHLVLDTVAPGWTTLSLVISGLLFLTFSILTLLGEYLARVLEETREQPLYYIKEETDSTVMLADASRRNVSDDSALRSAGGEPPP